MGRRYSSGTKGVGVVDAHRQERDSPLRARCRVRLQAEALCRGRAIPAGARAPGGARLDHLVKRHRRSGSELCRGDARAGAEIGRQRQLRGHLAGSSIPATGPRTSGTGLLRPTAESRKHRATGSRVNRSPRPTAPARVAPGTQRRRQRSGRECRRSERQRSCRSRHSRERRRRHPQEREVRQGPSENLLRLRGPLTERVFVTSTQRSALSRSVCT